MTRETKLGLLIGAGIILLIGIVVSDQLSMSRHSDAPAPTDYGLDTHGAQVSNAPTAGTAPLNGLNFGAAPSASATTGVTNPGATITIGSVPAPAPVPPSQTLDAAQNQAVATAEPMGPQPVMSLDSQPLPGARLASGSSIPAGSEGMAYRETTVAPISLSDTAPTAAPLAAAPALLADPAPAAMNKTIKVQSGDTLEKLARTYLGNGALWPQIVKANQDKIKKPEQLRVGMELTIPAMDSSPGKTTAATTSVEPAKTTASTKSSSTARTYTVQKGDSLYGIAKKELGNANLWKDLLQANKALLKGQASNLKQGMKLSLAVDHKG